MTAEVISLGMLSDAEREYFRQVWYLAWAILALGAGDEATAALLDVLARHGVTGNPGGQGGHVR